MNKCLDCGKELGDIRSKRCKSCSQKGKLGHNYIDGRCSTKHYCIDCGKKISLTNGLYGYKRCTKCDNLYRKNNKQFAGNNNPAYKDGRTLKPKCVICHNEVKDYRYKTCSRKCKKIYCKINKIMFGKNNPMFGRFGKEAGNYIHGKSREPYPLEFNEPLKEQIRKRDNYQCQNPECNMTEEEHIIVRGRVLDIHHIDYNKKNCENTNLISLCQQCNLRANSNRKYWKEIYQEKIKCKM